MSQNISRPKTSVFIATSIDGYIAKKDNDLDWLIKFPAPTGENEDKDCGYSKFFSTVDVLVMGRNSYDVVSKFDPWPYQGKRVIVLSSTLTKVNDQSELFAGNLNQLMEKLQTEGIKHIYVDGGAIISAFLNAGFIDHMIISIIPVVLGSGIPLFSNIHEDKWCKLISSQTFSNGLVQLTYDVVNKI